MKEKFVVIQTTYPNLRDAKNLGKILVEEKLAACVHFFPIEGVYVWEKKLHQGKEILVSIKTRKSLYKKVEKTILKHHEYEVPQIFSMPIDQGFTPYLEWIVSNSSAKK